MKVYRNLDNYDIEEVEVESICTIGNFDGVHAGHRAVIEKLLELGKKKNLKTCILTFEPHPKKVLFHPDFRILNDIEEKCKALSSFNVDVIIAHPFDEKFSRLKPKDFVDGVLKQKINAKHVVVGEDFSFGADKEGTLSVFKELLSKDKIDLTIVPAVVQNNVEIHSNMIRDLLQNGCIKEANKFLFEPYKISGKIVYGKKRGAELGFPTINFYNEFKVIPAKGVYVTQTLIHGSIYESITNIGNCPTFGTEKLRIETHILDFSEDVYGKYAHVIFYDRLRHEVKFPTTDALKKQIEEDVKKRRLYEKF